MIDRENQKMKTGYANLPLHSGKAPRWLFEKMVRLAREMTWIFVVDYGSAEFFRRLSDPYWFQALGCVLGFDWHSSGVTTTVCGALKEALREVGGELKVFAAGGKGAASRKTPSEIEKVGEQIGLSAEPLVYASRMAAKVDSAAVQDGYSIYHHTFFFDVSGNWCVVQQGMNEQTRYARRYHWLGESVKDFVCEPHQAICCDARGITLNLVAVESASARQVSTLLSREKPDKIIQKIQRCKELSLPARHSVFLKDIHPHRLHSILLSTYERRPETFETLLGMPGVGGKTLRALALVAELLYGSPVSYQDPARFSFAHGGKDGHPYPVDRDTYQATLTYLQEAISRARVGQTEKLSALRRLALLI